MSLSKPLLLPVWSLVPGDQVPKTGEPGYLGYSWNEGGHKGGSRRKIVIVKIVEKTYITPIYLQ